MSLFDSIRGALHDHPTVKNLAEKLGIDPETAEKAIAALAEAHQNPDGDTVADASAKTGISADTLRQVVEQIGGEGSLTTFAAMVDGDHSKGILGAAGKLFD